MTADADARAQALDPHSSFIVQAPAGSGKTGLLVYRILTLLSEVDKPEQILAITFTNKAVSEMRHRIMGLLKQAQSGEKPKNEFAQQGYELAQTVLRRDQQKGWQLMQIPQQLQILTIDAFCARLVTNMPWLSRLGDRPRTTQNPEQHYQAAIEQLLSLLHVESSHSKALQSVMLELDYDYNKARRLFVAMLGKRDQWLRHLVGVDLNQLKDHLQQTWRQITQHYLNEIATIFKASLNQEQQQSLLKCAIKAAESIEDDQHPIVTYRNLTRLPENNIADLAIWRAIKSLLLTNSNTLRGRVDKNSGFPPKTEHKDRMLKLLTELQEDETLRRALAQLDYVPEGHFSETDWQQLATLQEVLLALASFLQLRFRASGECDFSEVTQRANLALQELENPTDLGLRMDSQLQHILVDEFQDTSHAQVELLKKLTSGWGLSAQAEGQTLFLVGDPMQSIYRFREADVSLFLQVVEDCKNPKSDNKVFANVELQSLVLAQNFRSSNNLVDWFNQAFEISFPQQNKIAEGAIRYARAQSSNEPSDNPVSMVPVASRAEEAEQVVKQIRLAQTRAKPQSQIAILVRGRKHLQNILPALQQAKIDYVGVELQPLNETQAVLDVLALCKAICSHCERISWLALLRGPWCGLSLVEIKQLITDPGMPVWWQINNQQATEKLPSQAQQRLSRFSGIMRDALAQRQRVSIQSITYWAWQQLGGEQTLFDSSLSDIQVVLDLIGQCENGGDIEPLTQLDDALQGLNTTPANTDNQVIISTIHQAKGLQYDTVILPGLDKAGKKDDKEIMLWMEDIDSEGESKLLLAPIHLDNKPHSHYDYLNMIKKLRAGNELMRLMYVAATRAENKLVLIAKVNLNAKDETAKPIVDSLLAKIWPAVQNNFVAHGKESSQGKAENMSLDQTLYRLPDDFQLLPRPSVNWQSKHQLVSHRDDQSETRNEFEWASIVAQAVGVVLHDWLQFDQSEIKKIDIDDQQRQLWRAELHWHQVPKTRIPSALKKLEKAIKNMQQDEIADFIFKDYPQQENEYSLSTYESGLVRSYRIDRTFVDENEVRWIIDYKTTDTNNDNVDEFIDQQIAERHKDQLEKYGQLMSKIDKRPIKLGVYFPLLKQWRCWDFKP